MAAVQDDHQLFRKNPVLSLVSIVLITIGIMGLWVPSLPTAFLPPHVAKPLLENALLALLIGIAIQGYQIYLMVQLQKERTRKAALRAPAASPSSAFDPSGTATTPNLEWTPLKSGGANFRTGKLVQRSATRFEVQATPQVILFCWVFIAMGLIVGGVVTFGALQESPWSALFPALIGLLFTGVGAVMLYLFTRPAVFDRQLGWYWKGDTRLRVHHDVRQLKEATELSNIRGLQVLSEYCRGSKNSASYYSYELNLVLKDGRRINVMDHGNRETLAADADALAKFLGVPVWEQQSPP